MSRQYKEFKVGDLFELRGLKSIDKTKLIFKEEGVEFVGRTNINNGVQGYIEEQDFEPCIGGTISVSQVGTIVAQYRENQYYCSQNIVSLSYSRRLNRLESLYITTLINKVLRDSGFEGYTTPKQTDIKEFNIKLPITSQGIPDWQYMEDFMKEIESETQQTIETLDKISTLSSVGVGSYPEPYGYREFKVGDLFNIQPTKNYKMINKDLFVEGGINPVIVNTKFRNGVGGYTDKECTEDGGIITFSDTTNWESIFYQSKPFVGYPHVQGMYPKDSIEEYINMYNMMYIVTTFKVSAQSQGFDYQNKFNRKVAKELNIKLPITSQGGPDWQYMEDFMRYIEQESEEVINKIQNML